MTFLQGVAAREGEGGPLFDPLQALAGSGETGDTVDTVAERIVNGLRATRGRVANVRRLGEPKVVFLLKFTGSTSFSRLHNPPDSFRPN